MDELTQEPTESKRGISRRTVLAATAWSVPVVAVARAAPAFAGTQQYVQFNGLPCKQSGGSEPGHRKAYTFKMHSYNPNKNYSVLIVITGISLYDSQGTKATQGTPEYAIDPQIDGQYIPTGTINMPNEGQIYNCTMPTPGPLTQTSDGLLTTFTLTPRQNFDWCASMGQFTDSSNSGMIINFRVYILNGAGTTSDPYTCGTDLGPFTADSGIRETGTCCESSPLCPSYDQKA